MYGQEKRDLVIRCFVFTTEKVFIAASFQLAHCTYRCILQFLASLEQVIWRQYNPWSAFLQQGLLFLASRNGKNNLLTTVCHIFSSLSLSPRLQQAEYFRNNHKRNNKKRKTKQLPCSHGNAWEEFKWAPLLMWPCVCPQMVNRDQEAHPLRALPGVYWHGR